jgi:hypothetical protein
MVCYLPCSHPVATITDLSMLSVRYIKWLPAMTSEVNNHGRPHFCHKKCYHQSRSYSNIVIAPHLRAVVISFRTCHGA